jgi:uncharacterized protein (DUF342 family)
MIRDNIINVSPLFNVVNGVGMQAGDFHFVGE